MFAMMSFTPTGVIFVGYSAVSLLVSGTMSRILSLRFPEAVLKSCTMVTAGGVTALEDNAESVNRTGVGDGSDGSGTVLGRT